MEDVANSISLVLTKSIILPIIEKVHANHGITLTESELLSYLPSSNLKRPTKKIGKRTQAPLYQCKDAIKLKKIENTTNLYQVLDTGIVVFLEAYDPLDQGDEEVSDMDYSEMPDEACQRDGKDAGNRTSIDATSTDPLTPGTHPLWMAQSASFLTLTIVCVTPRTPWDTR